MSRRRGVLTGGGGGGETELDWPGSLAPQTLQQDEDSGGPDDRTGVQEKEDQRGPDRALLDWDTEGHRAGRWVRMIPYNQAVMMAEMHRNQCGGFLQSPTLCTTAPQPSVSCCRVRRSCFSPSEPHQRKPFFQTEA